MYQEKEKKKKLDWCGMVVQWLALSALEPWAWSLSVWSFYVLPVSAWVPSTTPIRLPPTVQRHAG